MNIDDLIREVQDNQNKILDVVNKYDDIYARKWDQELKSLFKGKVISNWTDFAYDKSVSYTITLKTNKP